MRTDAVLTLAQWLSPAYPVGAFAYSHGLEAAVAAGWVTDGADLEAWLTEVLTTGAGHNDALILAAAYHAATPDRLAEIDATARAFAASKERLTETDQQGAAFTSTTHAIWGGDPAPLTYPVALGAAAARAGLPLDLAQEMYLQAFLSNLVAAGQRLLPVGQTEGQAILARLSAQLPATAAATRAGDLDALSATAFLTDIAAMRHETQATRIFRT
ncbi:MAG: urease accessory protein UreF [Maritimibacter sp.]|nr:urease accessory protein UreF [Maritimibacter sp.]